MNNFFNFIISLSASVVAIVLTLLIDRRRFPELEIRSSADVDTTISYDGARAFRDKVKFCRVEVKNRQIHSLGLFPRQSAENCRATLDFFTFEDNKREFTLQGRWASTPELPFLSPQEAFLRMSNPDPVTIIAGSSETLDILIWHEASKEAFAWNNEAYSEDWKPQRYQLKPGKHIVHVKVSTQNGKNFREDFLVTIGNSIKDVKIQYFGATERIHLTTSGTL